MLSGLARAEGLIRLVYEVKREDDVKQLTHLDSHNQIVSYCPSIPNIILQMYFEIEPRAVGDVFFWKGAMPVEVNSLSSAQAEYWNGCGCSAFQNCEYQNSAANV